MKMSNLKFLSMAAIAAMTMFTACSDDEPNPNPNPNPDPDPDPTPSTGIYSSEQFLAEGNHNTINFDFTGTFTNGFFGTIDGGTDMSTVDNFFDAAAYQGAVAADNDWTAGWIRTEGNGTESSEDAVEELAGDLTEDKTLLKNQTYALSGSYNILDGVTLTIEEGVKIVAIDDNTTDYILVHQGGKIMAEGTAENPIVMTSDRKEPGAWGGLHICGKAHTNADGEVTSEIGNAPYGGNVEDDNSGTLRYVRIENSGYALDPEHEANGISFYGVGNGTKVEYVQAYNGSDDGFEFFGGSVDIKHAVVINCTDDSFDWTEGWNGRAQFLVAYQTMEECDCLMECDNNGNNFAAEPVAHPTIANVTLIGNGGDGQGVRLRAGTQVSLYNALIAGKGMCLTTETAETEQALADGKSVLNYVTLATDITCNGDEE